MTIRNSSDQHAKYIIHLSDIHFHSGWHENMELVLCAFFSDLKKQLLDKPASDTYFVFSGDIVKEGGNETMFYNFETLFSKHLKELNIPQQNLIVIPGNHDLSQDWVENNFKNHESIAASVWVEKEFNDYIAGSNNIFSAKFANFRKFQNSFTPQNCINDKLTCQVVKLDDNIEIFCINSAICSSGGFNKIKDKGRLGISTREISAWLNQSKAKVKILAMHHPIDWLSDWAQETLKILVRKNLSVILTGHNHNQDCYKLSYENTDTRICSAPPLFTDKYSELGYAIIKLNQINIEKIIYRQWTKKGVFVSGGSFSGTDDGIIKIQNDNEIKQNEESDAYIEKTLKTNLDAALQSFSSQPIVLVERLLSKKRDFSFYEDDDKDNSFENLDQLIDASQDTIIAAPPQFGLTCLAHQITHVYWKKFSKPCIYIDSKETQTHKLWTYIQGKVSFFQSSIDEIGLIILDSWQSFISNDISNLEYLCKQFPNINILVMNTINDSSMLQAPHKEEVYPRNFNTLYLLPLHRNHIRKVVSEYNYQRPIGDENLIISKIVTDLESLNLHRTPLNCLTLLKVSENSLEASPVNRTEMIKMVLFLLFNVDHIPSYKTRPDLKDCEFVLGRYCEVMLRSEKYTFSRSEMLEKLESYCEERVIDLEVEVVFDVLYANHIIVETNGCFKFRYLYWLYYFAAQRMMFDENFAQFVLEDKNYLHCPEIIEYYTGIDRSRSNAINQITNDLKEINNTVETKLGLRKELNPYQFLKWKVNDETINKMREEISKDVMSSKLPNEVKDSFADRCYDPKKPYNQSVRKIFKEYSLALLIQSIKASSRALRNSDYVSSEKKRELFKEIMRGWEQLTKVCFIISPIIAEKGHAIFEGIFFYMPNSDSNKFKQNLIDLFVSIPNTIVSMFENDLYSSKMRPLLFDQYHSETIHIRKHNLVLFLIKERPREWKKIIENYIVALPKDSFLLLHTIQTLRSEYSFSYASDQDLHDIAFLIKMCLAKHRSGEKKPRLDKIVKVKNSVLPKRHVDNV